IGIGFGKTLEHNLALIKHLGHFLHFGYPLLVGASRKSLIDKITPCSVEERLSGTLTIHLESLKNGASIIRCHDTKEHIQALKTWLALQEAKLDIPS
ncbi:MAG: dihydropteroate synthase, partial [Helicobacter sp.]|uniref:dihydropteroate synthase n=1 Tax=Helicobacter sp. TaxID=218 RepID=UPI0023C0564D